MSHLIAVGRISSGWGNIFSVINRNEIRAQLDKLTIIPDDDAELEAITHREELERIEKMEEEID